MQNVNKRKIKDFSLNLSTVIFTLFSLVVLVWMLVYIFSNGGKVLNKDFLFGGYSKTTITLKTQENYENTGLVFIDPNAEETSSNEDIGFSSRWGIKLKETNESNEAKAYFTYIASDSPFNNLVDNNGDKITIAVDYSLSSLILVNDDGEYTSISANDGAKEMCLALDKAKSIYDATMTSKGRGIFGSLMTTLLLILFSLLFALPLGICGAVYLGVYAKNNIVTQIIRTLIDVTSGIPSIIFGLAGAIIFIPFTNTLSGTTGGNIFSGSLTLAMILLPTIVKTTEEAIMSIPKSYQDASLALGANKTQTIFKIIIPNALSGILTSTFLSIGRIIGESAALVFSMGAIIADSASLNSSNASLAVHIWVILQGETPQYAEACAISIVILTIVVLLSIAIKLVTRKLNKFKGVK